MASVEMTIVRRQELKRMARFSFLQTFDGYNTRILSSVFEAGRGKGDRELRVVGVRSRREKPARRNMMLTLSR